MVYSDEVLVTPDARHRAPRYAYRPAFSKE
jgi:hypothetical protein